MAAPLLDRLGPLPRPGRVAWLTRGRERWEAVLKQLPDEARSKFDPLLGHPNFQPLLDAILGNSPYLARSFFIDAEAVASLLSAPAEESYAKLVAELRLAPAAPLPPKAEAMAILRRVKRRAALLIALCDVGGIWELEAVTDALTDLAEKSMDYALAMALRGAESMGQLTLPIQTDSHRHTGFVILGMGKLGARELNYSSDIDLMMLFDPEKADTLQTTNPQAVFINVAKQIVALLQERTEDGYAFRVDLRLRPDPAATPVVISIPAAERYYEGFGQNWERAAMIKARPVAGDRAAGEEFLDRIAPFVWRKYLDFAAIEDIHSVKRQIHAHRGHGQVTVAGHNLKLGRGGIREIEFFAQTQQLISGGREKRLRLRETCAAIVALAETGRVDQATASRMTSAYRELRRIEHRLQMIEDEQTHSMPTAQEDLEQIAAFLGDADAAAMETRLRRLLEGVERDYAALFEKSAPLSSEGNLVFTGVEDDPDTLATLARMGFREPPGVAATIRGWHHGRYRAMRSVRAREKLTQIMPRLLQALAASGDADAAFERFDALLAKLPSGVQLFSLFYSEPHLMDLIAELMGGAPHLGEVLSRHPYLFDSLLDPGFYDPLPDTMALAMRLAARLDDATGYEDMLDAARRWTQDRRLQVGVQMLRGIATPNEGAQALARIAEANLRTLLPRIEAALAESHGRVAGGQFAVLAMGRLGSGEMTLESDLDLIFIYDYPDGLEASDGPKPLPPSQYYARLSQRFISALTTLTTAGRLYDVDMRLRPSGNKGPVAVSLASFTQYQDKEAWTWEHMALCRARLVVGDGDLAARVTNAVQAILTKPRDPTALAAEVRDMRSKIAHQFPAQGPWDMKYAPGGAIDMEFLSAWLILGHSAQHQALLHSRPLDAVAAAATVGLIKKAQADLIVRDGLALQDCLGLLRLVGRGRSQEGDKLPIAILKRMAGRLALPDASAAAVETALAALQTRLHDLIDSILPISETAS